MLSVWRRDICTRPEAEGWAKECAFGATNCAKFPEGFFPVGRSVDDRSSTQPQPNHPMKPSFSNSALSLVAVALATSAFAVSAFAGPSPQFPVGQRASVTAPAKKAPAKSAAETTPQSGGATSSCNHGCSGCRKG
jgi:hypothetical protein